MEPEVEFCWDDILADDVGLMGEYPVGCLRAVFTGYFLFCVRIVHGSDGLMIKDLKCSFDVAVEINIFFGRWAIATWN